MWHIYYYICHSESVNTDTLMCKQPFTLEAGRDGATFHYFMNSELIQSSDSQPWGRASPKDQKINLTAREMIKGGRKKRKSVFNFWTFVYSLLSFFNSLGLNSYFNETIWEVGGHFYLVELLSTHMHLLSCRETQSALDYKYKVALNGNTPLKHMYFKLVLKYNTVKCTFQWLVLVPQCWHMVGFFQHYAMIQFSPVLKELE